MDRMTNQFDDAARREELVLQALMLCQQLALIRRDRTRQAPRGLACALEDRRKSARSSSESLGRTARKRA